MKQTIIVILLILLLLLTSCMTSSDVSRGSLSDAMEKARDDYEEEREVPSEEKDDWPFEDEDENEDSRDESEGNEDVLADYGTLDDLDFSLSVRGGTNFYSDPFFNSVFEGDLVVGFIPENMVFKFNVFAGVKPLTTQPDDSISDSIKDNPMQLNAGVEFLYYPFPKLKFFSPHLIGRVGGFYLFWEFKNPLVSGGDTISSDYVGGLLLGGGVGVNLIRLKSFFLAAQVLPELYLFGEETSEGFHNDYFGTYGTVRFAVEAGISF